MWGTPCFVFAMVGPAGPSFFFTGTRGLTSRGTVLRHF
jgi:hypothetical protein